MGEAGTKGGAGQVRLGYRVRPYLRIAGSRSTPLASCALQQPSASDGGE